MAKVKQKTEASGKVGSLKNGFGQMDAVKKNEAEKTAAKSVKKAAAKPTEKAAAKPTEKATARQTEKATARQTEKAAAKTLKTQKPEMGTASGQDEGVVVAQSPLPRDWQEELKPKVPKKPKTEKGREQYMISLAVDLAEKQLREGTASAQVVTHYLKLGTEKERLEREILREQKDLISEKTKALKSMKQIEELYSEAIEAMKRYSGNGDE